MSSKDIKKALHICSGDGGCYGCLYVYDAGSGCIKKMSADALAYIGRLESKLSSGARKVVKQRQIIKKMIMLMRGDCNYCAHKQERVKGLDCICRDCTYESMKGNYHPYWKFIGVEDATQKDGELRVKDAGLQV